MKKKLKVIEIDKNNKEISLGKKRNPLIAFLRNHNTHLIILLFIMALLFLLTSGFIFIKNINTVDKPNYNFFSIDTTLKDYNEIILGDNVPLTDTTAKNNFFKNSSFKNQGAIFLEEEYKTENYTIKFFSDGTALKIVSGSIITRVSPLKNGKYGIDRKGTIKKGTCIRDIKVISKKKYPWGEVTYYSDNSAEIDSKNINLFVRNATEIMDKYISNNKISYLKETKEYGKYKINYYYDGTLEIIDGENKYLIRNSSDIKITENKITFPNANQSTIYKKLTLSDGKIIEYYTDGGAIIKDKDKHISVRKSNSIRISDNKIIEIVDNIYVEESHKKNNVIYYTNGGAYFIYKNKKYYTDENSNIIFENNLLKPRENNELLTKETNFKDEKVKLFKENAIIEKNNQIAIVPKSSILFDKFGKVIDTHYEANDKNNSFTITNNTNNLLKYRIVIEESKKTDLNSEYIKYQMQVKEKYYAPKKLNNNVWKTDTMSKDLKLKDKNYILVEDTISSGDTVDINLMLWTDYETIPNSMQNKHFYGTIKVYAWLDN